MGIVAITTFVAIMTFVGLTTFRPGTSTGGRCRRRSLAKDIAFNRRRRYSIPDSAVSGGIETSGAGALKGRGEA